MLAAFHVEAARGVSSRSDFETLKGRYLGREKGLVPALFARMREIPPADRASYGARANAAKREIEEAVARLGDLLAEGETERSERAAAVDVTLPGRRVRAGSLHPVTIVRRRVEEIFLRMGYSIADGPEIENDANNFEALNFPPEHPARDAQDTLFLNVDAPSPLLLRTHTSPVQIREMKKRGAPIKIIAPGRVYRNESVDATHQPVFHQVEALVVDRGISMADLKGTVETFFEALFGPGTRVRIIPTFFPFVEPGADVHVSCIFCKGSGCRTCKGSGWMELAGAGEVHPRVLEACGIDPEEFSGFAFGLGLDRVAMMLYEFPDLRLLFEGEERFLSQFAPLS
ncbi:MAG: phenylalanine--tRNA ligase subunit alpha [Acidobacteriota bacterium]|nr:phenylalanine--tRNA ligase subunit alpha [Acidobacteriota bacterium]MDQ5872134.1 phenylalanine--tRNA ligase subunit alpha [Acidobacteriota bacterium]